MNRRTRLLSLTGCGLHWLLVACSADTAADSSGAFADPGVGQGGAQDIGAFREQLDQEQIPTLEMLDDVGFFNEHKIELPGADCDQPICLHAALGVMGNMINGANCTMLFLGMNTTLDLEQIERRPIDLALAIDTSGSMQGAPLENVQIGLEMMLDRLEPADRVSLVIFSDVARSLVQGAAPDSEELRDTIRALVADGGTNIYEGLAFAYEELDQREDGDAEQRVILLSDGAANVGLSDADRMLALSVAYAEAGIALSTIGFGDGFDTELLRELSVVGQGSYYFTDSPLALREVFTEEVQTSLVPLARQARIDVAIAPGYEVRGVYGTKQYSTTQDSVRIDIPVLQIAHRTSADDDALGRRGGGGVIIVELTPDSFSGEGSKRVGDVELRYQSAMGEQAGTTLEQSVAISSPHDPGEAPAEGHFDDASVEKAFVMLNIYAGVRTALLDVEAGDWSGAEASLASLEASVRSWLEQTPDPDILADLTLIQRLREVIAAQAVAITAVAPRPPWPVD